MRNEWRIDKSARENARRGSAFLTVQKSDPDEMRILNSWLDFWYGCGEHDGEEFIVKEHGHLISVYRTTYKPRFG